jgi:hypothetical protein
MKQRSDSYSALPQSSRQIRKSKEKNGKEMKKALIARFQPPHLTPVLDELLDPADGWLQILNFMDNRILLLGLYGVRNTSESIGALSFV